MAVYPARAHDSHKGLCNFLKQLATLAAIAWCFLLPVRTTVWGGHVLTWAVSQTGAYALKEEGGALHLQVRLSPETGLCVQRKQHSNRIHECNGLRVRHIHVRFKEKIKQDRPKKHAQRFKTIRTIFYLNWMSKLMLCNWKKKKNRKNSEQGSNALHLNVFFKTFYALVYRKKLIHLTKIRDSWIDFQIF